MHSVRGQGGQLCDLPGEVSAGQGRGEWERAGGFKEGQSICAGESRQPLL